MFEKIKSNKLLKTIWNIVYTILFIIVVLMLLVVILQRVTNNNITIAGIRIFSVATGSMKPHYEIGDVLIAKEVGIDNINVGDDIVYEGKVGSFNKKVITHRVIEKEKKDDGNYRIVTKGTANEIEDPEIDQTQIIGKVIYKVYILSFLGKLVQNLYKLYFFIFIPIALLIFKQIKAIVGSREDEEDEE